MKRRRGYVLAGGKSSRMGRNKALLPYRGGILLEAVLDAVTRAAGSATIVGDQPELAAFCRIPDQYPGEGPLGGILTALADSDADWNLIVACDMPALTADFLGRLLDQAEHCEGNVLVPVNPSGRVEPLCAAYHRNCLEELSRAFGDGVRKIVTALEGARTVAWQVQEDLCFQNINTPEEWAAYDR